MDMVVENVNGWICISSDENHCISLNACVHLKLAILLPSQGTSIYCTPAAHNLEIHRRLD